MQLRPYQAEADEKIDAGFKNFRRQLIVMPTASGKTIVAGAAARRYPRTLFIAHREELLYQAMTSLDEHAGLTCDLEKAEARAELGQNRLFDDEARVVVASIQTLDVRKERFAPDYFDLVIVDEAHHVAADSYLRTLRYFDGHAKVLGVTGTPDRADQKNLGMYFQNIAYEVGLVELIKQGYIAPLTIQTIPVKIDLSKVSIKNGEFDATESASAIEPYLDEIARIIAREAPKRRSIAFLPLVATSKRFVEACAKADLRALHVDGETKNRKDLIQEFKDGKYQILSNCAVATEGFDCPAIDCVIPLRPTKSRSLYAQICGRGFRIVENKTDCLLLDFIWLHEKHKLIRPAHLIATKLEYAEKMTKILEDGRRRGMDEVESAAKKALILERERKLAEEIAAQEGRKAKLMSALEYSVALKDIELGDPSAQVLMPWHAEAPTLKQLALIEKMGIDPAPVKSRGHATALIERLIVRSKNKLASPWQLRLLRRVKHPSPETLTRDEAKLYLDEKFKRHR